MVGGFEIKLGSATGYVTYLSNGTCCDHERETLTKGVVYQPYLLESSVLAPTMMAEARWLAGIGLDAGEPVGAEEWLRIINGQSMAGTQLVSRPTAGVGDGHRTVMTDFVVSLPKSISLEYFHLRQTGQHQTADALLAAFQRSIATGLSGLQDEVKMFRVGSGSMGTRTPCKGSLGAITFLHETARPVAGSAENPHIMRMSWFPTWDSTSMDSGRR